MDNEEKVTREEVESWCGCAVDECLFESALEHARHKQRYLFKQTGRSVIMQHWYLVQLTAEYAGSLALMEYTEALVRNRAGKAEREEKNGQFSSSRS